MWSSHGRQAKKQNEYGITIAYLDLISYFMSNKKKKIDIKVYKLKFFNDNDHKVKIDLR